MTGYGYQLTRLSGPDIEPVTLEEQKRQMKVDADLTYEDTDTEEDISAAREMAEDYCHQTFCPTLWRLSLNGFTGCDIPLPMGPLIELVGITYLDSSGVRQSVDLTTVKVSQNSQPPYIGGFYSSGRCEPGAVQIDYWAGYPTTGSPEVATGVPKRAKKAIKMLVAHWYANREAVVATGRVVPDEMLYSFERCLDQLKQYP